jgi:thiamine biosynthesis protein ThiI
MSDLPNASVISAHYAEIALKGKNRGMFQRKLRNNMMQALAGEPVEAVNHVESRFLIRLEDPAAADRCVDKLKRVFGIQWLARSEAVPRTGDHDDDMERLKETARRIARAEAGAARTFRLESRRSDRKFPLTSTELNIALGDVVQPVLNIDVKLKDPDYTLYVLVLAKEILVFSRKEHGGGGLPSGSSGRLMALLSGGIDSPVAAWMMMKRGCRPEFVHFYSGRSLKEANVDKIVRLAADVARWSPVPLSVHMVPVYPYEVRAVGAIDDSHDMVLFRRFMVKTAERFAKRENCHALVTGDSVGQVASQTLPNLRAISPDVKLPILRPLVGFDKVEIVDLAKRIGVYKTAIEPYRDCCSLRSPRPELNAKASTLLELSEKIDMDAAVEEAIRTSDLLKIGPEGRIES